jgi:nucleotide-binding universal stress UspA family protein
VAVPDNLLAEAETAARDYLDGLAPPLRERGLKVQCVTMIGHPAESIVHYAEENRFNLVALATHGRSGLKRLVFGSVADYVIRKSGLPILLIKPK